MRNIKLILEYDGTDFSGFQLQPRHTTIQEVLEKALSKFFNKRVKIQSASGRTDAGVHALGQVVNFKIVGAGFKPAPTPWQILKGLNAHLPPDIAVTDVEDVEASFHARFSAKKKTYEYLIWNRRARSPFWERYAHHVISPLDLKAMRKAAKFLTGRHDFRSFCATEKPGQPIKNTVRSVDQLFIKKEASFLKIQITANGFLHHMVRNIVGTLLEVGRGKLAPEKVKEILQKRDRRQAGMKAPAKGLRMVSVTY